MAREVLVGIDLGSTNTKVIAFDRAGVEISTAFRPARKVHPSSNPAWIEWDPLQLWTDVCSATREVVAGLTHSDRVFSIAVTGMGMDGLPMDKAGRTLHPFISWHDGRSEEEYRWWLREIGADTQFSIGGNTIWPFSSALRILWMQKHRPDVMAGVYKWVLIEDYINLRLCGVWATDYSMASTTLLFDLKTRNWSDSILKQSGIDRGILCEPRPSGTVLGRVTAGASEATGLDTDTLVVLGGHDCSCGVLPAGGMQPGTLVNIVGTWEIVQTTVGAMDLKPSTLQQGVAVEAHVAPGLWSMTASAVSGELIEWFRRNWFPEATESKWFGDELNRLLASERPGASGMLCLPHLCGGGSPHPDDRSRAAFVGLNPGTTRASIARSIVEALCHQFLEMTRSLIGAGGAELERMVVVGGGTRNHAWMQAKADILCHPVETSAQSESTALGAAMLAGVGAGLYRDLNEACGAVKQEGMMFVPNPAHRDLYREQHEIYKKLFPTLSECNHLLSDFAAIRLGKC